MVLTVVGCRDASGPSPTTSTTSTTTTTTTSSAVHVFGRVVDYRTTAGVPRSTIAFYIPPFDATAASVVADESGFYSAMLPPGTYNPRINGDSVANNAGTIVPVGSQYLADYYVNGGDCVLFYGTVRDAATGAPVAGATVTLTTTARTGSDGSYRLDLGCPTPNPNGFPPFGTGTVFMIVTSPGYATRQPFGTRREFIRGLQRIDVSLDRAS
jgi:hypothetical protein